MAYPISDVPRRIVYSGSAGVGPYAFTFEVLAASDIAVYKNQTLLTLTTDYTVSINTGTGTGTVTLVVAATGSDTVTLVGDRAIQRTSDFVTGGDLFANTLNAELDAQTIYAQQIDEKAERAIRAPVTDPTTINMVLPPQADRAGKILRFGSNGDPEVSSISTISGPTTDSSLVEYLPAGTNAVARTVQSRLRDVVSVFDFMTSAQIADVLSNGYSVDVSGAVQAAIDANATNGAHLWFPKGTYRFNSGVTLPSNSTAKWVFDAPLGTTIRTSNAITLIARTPTSQANADQMIAALGCVTIRNLTFQGSINSGQVGIAIGATYGALVDSCNFFDLGTAVLFRFGLKTYINNCTFGNIVTDSIRLDYGNWSGATNTNSQSNMSTINSCRVYNRAGANSAFYIRASSGVAIRDSIIEGLDPVYGIFFDAFGSTVVKDFTIDNLHVECLPTAAAIFLKGQGGCCSIRGVFMQGTLPTGAYFIDNSQNYGTPISIDIADIPFLVSPNPAGFIFKTTYTSVWTINDPAQVFSGTVISTRMESVDAPLRPGIISITGSAQSAIVRMQAQFASIAANLVLNLSAGDDSNYRANRYLRLASNLAGTDAVRIDIERGNQEIDFVSTLVKVNGATCPQSTSFTTADGKTVQVRNGFITSVT